MGLSSSRGKPTKIAFSVSEPIFLVGFGGSGVGERDGKRAVVRLEYSFDRCRFVVSSLTWRVQGEGEEFLVRLEVVVPVLCACLRDKL